ncbi:hypothetical protein GCM10027093_05650 [Paraburkholderia jirisanensis]
MNWVEFVAGKAALNMGDELPLLMASSEGMDNATRDEVSVDRGADVPMNAALLHHVGPGGTREFVWAGANTVCVLRSRETGGHPFLVHGRPVYCAGMLEYDSIFFHSGHYKPQTENVLQFMCRLVELCCEHLGALQRDPEVDRLCNIPLQLYYDNQTVDTYSTTLATLINNGRIYVTAPVRGKMTMAPSRPHPAMLASRAAPIAAASSSAPFRHATQSILDTGVTPAIQHRRTLKRPGRRPEWLDDNQINVCARCNTRFTLFTRRHHCRECGDVFCAACSSHTQTVALPAIRPGSAEETGPLRVCDWCYGDRADRI